jgi:hypothetical protein
MAMLHFRATFGGGFEKLALQPMLNAGPSSDGLPPRTALPNLFLLFGDKLFHGISTLPRYGVLAEPPHLIENESAFHVCLRLRRTVLSCFLA